MPTLINQIKTILEGVDPQISASVIKAIRERIKIYRIRTRLDLWAISQHHSDYKKVVKRQMLVQLIDEIESQVIFSETSDDIMLTLNAELSLFVDNKNGEVGEWPMPNRC